MTKTGSGEEGEWRLRGDVVGDCSERRKGSGVVSWFWISRKKEVGLGFLASCRLLAVEREDAVESVSVGRRCVCS